MSVRYSILKESTAMKLTAAVLSGPSEGQRRQASTPTFTLKLGYAEEFRASLRNRINQGGSVSDE